MRALFVISLAIAASVPIHASMHDAVAASTLLRDIAEPRVVRLTLGSAARESVRTEVYGIAFNFENCAWFYSAEEGNRVLGAALPEEITPTVLTDRLHRAGIPVTQITVYPRVSAPPEPPGQTTIPNACVIGALLSLRNRLVGSEPISEAGLVLLSYRTGDAETAPTLSIDHCLLVFRTAGGWGCIDPRKADEVLPLDHINIGEPVDSRLMAVALRSRYPLKSARLLPIASSTLEAITTATLWRIAHKSTDLPP
jgi:hypothetical protein